MVQTCKLVSIKTFEYDTSEKAVIEDRLGTVRVQTVGGLDLNILSYENTQRIWTPSAPLLHINTILSSPTARRNQSLEMTLNMDFGGPQGSLLSSLRQIVARMFGFPSVFLGFKFVYENGEHRFFGSETAYDPLRNRQPCIDWSFPINGAQGERLSGVEVYYDANGKGLNSIKVTFIVPAHAEIFNSNCSSIVRHKPGEQ
jgi:hypothetical protein